MPSKITAREPILTAFMKPTTKVRTTMGVLKNISVIYVAFNPNQYVSNACSYSERNVIELNFFLTWLGLLYVYTEYNATV